MVGSPLDRAAGGSPPDGGRPVCSARGCRRPALWALRWNNPRLHTPERRKIWTACDEHRPELESFLRSRGFLRDTVPVGELDAGGGDGVDAVEEDLKAGDRR